MENRTKETRSHPGEAFKEHSGSKKHTDAICSKKEIQSILSKGNSITQLQRGKRYVVKLTGKKQRLDQKTIKTVYFLAKNNMAAKPNFEKFEKFIAFQLEEKLFASHLSNAPKNANYCTANSVEEYVKVIRDFLNEKLIDDLVATGDVTVLADESTDDANRSQMALFVRYIDASTNLPVEHFMQMAKLTTSKKDVDLHEILINVLNSKGIDSSKFIRFVGLDGTNAMSGERKGLQRLIRRMSPHSLYINCRNHRLALCLVHLLPKYGTLTKLDGLLISIWKIFHFSTIKQSVFENAQVEYDLKPTKIIKAAVTRWLTHGEACARVISRFHPLIDALDAVYLDKGDAEAKGVRDILLDPDIICMLLLLAEVLSPINMFSKFLQTGTLIYSSVSANVNRLLERLLRIKEELKDHDSVETEVLL